MDPNLGFERLEEALYQSGELRNSETFLDFLGWKRELLNIAKNEKQYLTISNQEVYLRGKALRELDRLALKITGSSFVDLCLNPMPDSIPLKSDLDTRTIYESSIVAILDANGAVVGTGFTLNYSGNFLVITCAHIVFELEAQINDEVRLNHFSPRIGRLDASVSWLNYRSCVSPIDWTAKEDIAVLQLHGRVLGNCLSKNNFVFMDWNSILIRDCWCFGYIQSRKSRGAWIKNIDCMGVVGNGFIQLVQSSDTKFEKGISGSPLCNDRGEFLGMIQSIYGEHEAYLIPAETIIDIINNYIFEGGDTK
jgi:hypothetical protein